MEPMMQNDLYKKSIEKIIIILWDIFIYIQYIKILSYINCYNNNIIIKIWFFISEIIWF